MAARSSYAVPKPSGKLKEDFTTNEKAVTCGVRFQAGPGYAWVLGGGFVENFDYSSHECAFLTAWRARRASERDPQSAWREVRLSPRPGL